jgi:DNA invertase Pin-like site-specific DNA recombinase
MPLDINVKIPRRAGAPFPGAKGRACIYSRVSGENDHRTLSLETQAQGGVDVLVHDRYFLEKDDVRFERFTGVNSVALRDELLDILDLVEQGYYQAFYIHDPDRLVRGIEVVNIVNQIEDAGCVVYLNGKVSEPSDERDLLLAVAGYASKKEWRKIAERTGRVRNEIAERGEWVGGGGPRYGLVFDKKTRARTKHPEYGPVVVRIFEAIAEGMSTIKMARILNAEGIPSPGAVRSAGKPGAKDYRWLPARVAFIIREPTYMGMAYRNRMRYKRDERGRIVRKGRRKMLEPVPQKEWILCPSAKTEALVSEQLWRRANAALSDNATIREKCDRTRQDRRFYLLRGYLHCGRCRQRMYPVRHQVGGKTKGRRYSVYRCNTWGHASDAWSERCGLSVHADKIEAMIKPIVKAAFDTPGFLESMIDRAYADDDRTATFSREMARTRATIDRRNCELEGLTGDLAAADLGERSRQAIRARMRLTETEIDELEAQAASYASRLAAFADRDRLKAEHKQRLAALRSRVKASGLETDQDYREAIEGLPMRFYWLKGKLSVEWETSDSLDLSGTAVSTLSSRG